MFLKTLKMEHSVGYKSLTYGHICQVIGTKIQEMSALPCFLCTIYNSQDMETTQMSINLQHCKEPGQYYGKWKVCH